MALPTHRTRSRWAWNRPLSQYLTYKPPKILVLKPNFRFFGPFPGLLPWNPLPTGLSALSALIAHNIRI